MKTISAASWEKYIKALKQVDNKATEAMLYYIQEFGIPSEEESLVDFIYAAFNISTKYGEAASALAASWYDAGAELQGVILEPAVPAATATVDETARAVTGAAKTGNPNVVADTVGRLVRQAGADTTLQNAIRDGAWVAWIPRGETCAFCLMLASNGWQAAGKAAKNGDHAAHIHANCDCTYAVRHRNDLVVEGYDPARYLQMYKYELDENGNVRKDENGRPVKRGGSWTSKLNGMRRDFYARTKAEAARRSMSDAERSELLNSSAAEEADV